MRINDKKFIARTAQIYLFFAALSAFVLIPLNEANAVRISMKRVIFSEGKKSETITIINNTTEEKTYRLGWRKYVMDEKKSLRAVDDDIVKETFTDWADDMVRYAPRRVVVAPGASQQIRLLFRRPANLEEKEYRSHLWIVTENKPNEFDKGEKPSQGHSVKLAVQPAISLPVFVRNGNLSATASISDTAAKILPDNKLEVSFTLHREGNRSLYGDFDFICSDSQLVMHQVRGVSIYTEISKRFLDFKIPLETAEEKSCKSISIIYKSDPNDSEYNGALLAQGNVNL